MLMGTFSRLRYVIAANVNALLEKAEDPEKLLRALIREMEDAGDEARLASADLLAEQRHLQRRHGELEAEAAQWQERAERAVADQRDDLARAALLARGETLARRDALLRGQDSLNERLASLEADMATLKQKLGAAKLKLKSLAERPRSYPASGAGAPSPSTPAERRVRRAFGRFDRLQSQVEHLEARVQSYETGGNPPSVWTAPATPDPAVDRELERLKSRLREAAGDAEAPSSAETAGPAA
jgi:phage shock protein A